MGKEYLYYQRVSIKEGLDIESEKIHLDIYDKDLSKRCEGCRQTFKIKKKNSNYQTITVMAATIF